MLYALGEVVLIVIGAQAVREEVFNQPGFYIPMASRAVLLVASEAIRWEGLMATKAAPWISAGWLVALIIGISALAIIPELSAVALPIPYGIAAVT